VNKIEIWDKKMYDQFENMMKVLALLPNEVMNGKMELW
jgi:hypothetical protein